MKFLTCLSLIILFVACHSGSKTGIVDTVVKKISVVDTEVKRKITGSSMFKPYQLNGGYTAIDTGFLDLTVMEANYAIITKNGKLVDTIDKGYGIQKIDDTHYLYLTVTRSAPLDTNTNTPGTHGFSGSLSRYVIVSDGTKQNLSELTTGFNEYFSSPSVINGKIYFWQIEKTGGEGNNKISAAVFDPLTKQKQSRYIKDDFIETDDAGYFAAPYMQNDTVYFDGANDKLKKFDKDLKAYN